MFHLCKVQVSQYSIVFTSCNLKITPTILFLAEFETFCAGKHKQNDSVRARRIFTVATLVRHCTYERDIASFEYCPSSLMSWAIPSALTGNYTVTDNASETPSSMSSDASDSSSSGPATASISLSEDPRNSFVSTLGSRYDFMML